MTEHYAHTTMRGERALRQMENAHAMMIQLRMMLAAEAEQRGCRLVELQDSCWMEPK